MAQCTMPVSRIENVNVNVPLRNVVVRNGIVAGFNGPGFNLLGPRNCVFEHLMVTECTSGFSFQAFGTAGVVGNVVRNCRMFCRKSGEHGCRLGVFQSLRLQFIGLFRGASPQPLLRETSGASPR